MRRDHAGREEEREEEEEEEVGGERGPAGPVPGEDARGWNEEGAKRSTVSSFA